MKASEALKDILEVLMQEGDCEIMLAEGTKHVPISKITGGYDSTSVSAGEISERRIIRIIRR